MWKEGTPLIIAEKTTNIFFRIFLFLIAAGITALCIMEFPKSNEKDMLWLLAIIPIILLCLYLAFGKENPSSLTIDSKGIKPNEKESIDWEQIDYAYIEHVPAKKNRNDSYDALKIKYRDDNNNPLTKVINLSNYKANKDDIHDAVEYFSKRDIGDISDLRRDQIIQAKLASGEITMEEGVAYVKKVNQYTSIFKEEKKRETKAGIIVSVITFLLLVILDVVLFLNNQHVDGDMICQIAFVVLYPITILTAYLFTTHYLQSKFGQRPEIMDLSNDEYKEYLPIATNEKPNKNTRTERIIGLILSLCCLVVLLYKTGWLH